MASYYYFGTTLPSLAFRGTAPASYASFLERSAVHLSKRDHAALVGASLAVPSDGKEPQAARVSRLLRNYYRWERALRNELARGLFPPSRNAVRAAVAPLTEGDLTPLPRAASSRCADASPQAPLRAFRFSRSRKCATNCKKPDSSYSGSLPAF